MVEPLISPASRRGRPRRIDLCEVVNGLRYPVQTGCGWEMLPTDFPPWQAVCWRFRTLEMALCNPASYLAGPNRHH